MVTPINVTTTLPKTHHHQITNLITVQVELGKSDADDMGSGVFDVTGEVGPPASGSQ